MPSELMQFNDGKMPHRALLTSPLPQEDKQKSCSTNNKMNQSHTKERTK